MLPPDCDHILLLFGGALKREQIRHVCTLVKCAKTQIRPIEEFRVWAYDGSSYLENWDSKAMGRLPKGIRMEIKLKSRSGQSDVTFNFEEEISS
ncbi:MAG: hypothetical protein QW212_05360 [Nitrososphaerales archaeon]